MGLHMTAGEAKLFIRSAFKPLDCGAKGERYKSAPIEFQVRDQDGNVVYTGKIMKSEYQDKDLLTNHLSNARDAVQQKGFKLHPWP